MNAAEQPLRFKLQATGLDGLKVVTDHELTVPATESRWVSVRLHLPYDAAQPGSHPIHFRIQSFQEGQGSQAVVGAIEEKSVFLVPR